MGNGAIHTVEFKLLTLRWSPSLDTLDDTPLLALAAHHEVLSIREHLVLVHDVPHLVCLVTCQPRTTRVASPNPAAARTASHAEPSAIPEPTPASEPSPAPPETPTRPPHDQRTYDAIRRWRAEQAHTDGVPRYVILTNRNIDALVRERPTSLAALARIPGIGPAKVERHGHALLALLRSHPSTAPAPEPMVLAPHDPALPVAEAHPHEDPAA